jgi:hypothetical protein
MISELYMLKRERWQLDTVYDDKELALADARSVMASSSPPEAVQVREAGAGGRVIFKKKRGGFATLGEIRVLKDRKAEAKERRERRQRHADAEAERARRIRRRRLIAAGLLLGAVIIGGSVWFAG